jgi:DNA-binding transcriptional LysR family regulator
MPGFVAAGFGVAIVPPEASKYADVVSLKITEPITRRAIGVAWAQGRYLSASARLFRDFAAATKSPSG